MSQNTLQTHFEKGLQAYQQKNWAEAKTHFFEALKLDAANTELMTNYGLTLWQLNEKPESIAWMRRAIESSDSSSNAKAKQSLTYMLSNKEFSSLEEVRSPAFAIKESLFYQSSPALFLSLLAMSLLAFGWLIIPWLASKSRNLSSDEGQPLKKISPNPVLIGFSGLMLFFTLTLTVTQALFRIKPRGTIINQSVIEIKAAPTDSSLSVASILPASIVKIENESQEWTRITASDGKRGWIPSKNVFKHSLN